MAAFLSRTVGLLACQLGSWVAGVVMKGGVGVGGAEDGTGDPMGEGGAL